MIWFLRDFTLNNKLINFLFCEIYLNLLNAGTVQQYFMYPLRGEWLTFKSEVGFDWIKKFRLESKLLPGRHYKFSLQLTAQLVFLEVSMSNIQIIIPWFWSPFEPIGYPFWKEKKVHHLLYVCPLSNLKTLKCSFDFP